MADWGRRAVLAALGLVALGAGPAHATRIRPGTISFGGNFEYAALSGSSYLASAFNHGVGGGVTIRYRMRGGWSAGVVFGEQTFQARANADTLDRLRVITAGFEVGRFFGPNENPAFIMLGAGVWDPTAFPAGETAVSRDQQAYELNKNDAIYLSAEAGVEVFIRRSMALDLSGRVMVHQSRELDYPYPIEDLNSPKHTNREFRLVAGLHFYVLD